MSRCVTKHMSLVQSVIINLINVVFSCVPYHSRFLTYQTKLSLLQLPANVVHMFWKGTVHARYHSLTFLALNQEDRKALIIEDHSPT